MCPQNKQANFFIYVQFNEKHSDLLSVHAAPTMASRTKSLFTIGLICPVINPQDSSKANTYHRRQGGRYVNICHHRSKLSSSPLNNGNRAKSNTLEKKVYNLNI